MSASLVGSEMCIRDSLSPARVGPAVASAAITSLSGQPHAAEPAVTHIPCLLYTSDAADDM
eukprot:4827420-Alexandrium_andersonii.AAC.1